MTTYYLSKGHGSDSASGTSLGEAWNSFKAVWKNVGPDDTLKVYGGAYQPQIIKIDGFKMLGFDGAKLDGSRSNDPHGLLVFADNVTVSGFEIANARTAGVAAARGSDYFTLTNSFVHDNGGNGVSLIGGTGYIVSGNEISYNYGLKSNAVHATSGVSLFNSRGLEGYERAYGAKIVNNEIHHNGNEGSTDGGGFIADKTDRDNLHPYDTPILFKGNTVYENGGPGAYIYKSDNAVVRDNFFFHNAQDKDRPRGMEIGLNDAHNVKVYNNVVEADGDRFAFYSGGPGHNTVDIRGNILYSDGHDDGGHVVAPWTGATQYTPDRFLNRIGVDPADVFDWWPRSDQPNWDV